MSTKVSLQSVPALDQPIKPQSLRSGKYRKICKKMERKISQRLVNHPWLCDCLSYSNGKGNPPEFPYVLDEKADSSIKGNPDGFPYVLDGKAGSGIKSFKVKTGRRLRSPVALVKPPKACFVINVPIGVEPNVTKKRCKKRIQRILDKLSNEAFKAPHVKASTVARSRIGVVFGLNQMASLDRERDRNFQNKIQEIQAVSDVVYRVIGFFWKPIFAKTDPYKDKCGIYPPKKSYRLIKVLDPKMAACILASIEDHSQKKVPYQCIRQVILQHSCTRRFEDVFRKRYKKAALYNAFLDADTLSLVNSHNKGIFRKIEQIVEPHAVIGFGYRLASTETPLLQLACKLDMRIRAAMQKELSFSPYFPEPFLFVRQEKRRQGRRFYRPSFKGAGSALESRRLIQNGLENRSINQKGLFFPNGGVTTTPERFRTKVMRSTAPVNANTLDNLSAIKALRGVSQTHLCPKKWADQVYLGLTILGFKCTVVTDATAPMQEIFKLYDPISKMRSLEKNYNFQGFQAVIRNYKFAKVGDVKVACKCLSSAQKKDRKKHRKNLQRLGVKKTLINRVEKTALESGKAVYRTLKRFA